MVVRLLVRIMRLRLWLLNDAYKRSWKLYGPEHPETLWVKQRWLKVANNLVEIAEEEYGILPS